MGSTTDSRGKPGRILRCDVDGTLAVSQGAGTRAMTRVFADHFGIENALAEIDFAGRSDRWIVAAALERAARRPTAEVFARFQDAYLPALSEELRRGSRLLPGVAELLNALADRPVLLGLGTGNFRRAAQAKLAHLGVWEHFRGGGFGDGRFVATGAGAGLRLTPHLGLDLELTHLSSSGGAETATPWFGGISVFSETVAAGSAHFFPDVDDYRFPSVRIQDRGKDVTTFLTKLTVEFPIADGLLFPYLTGGGGVGRVAERFSTAIDPIPWIPLNRSRSTARGGGSADDGSLYFSDSGIFPRPDAAEIGLSLVLGGGVDVRLWRGLGAGVDIRWLRILRNYGAFDTAQVTARASYRF